MPGDNLLCLSKELEQCINNPTFKAKVMDRDQGMPSRYYKISTDDYKDYHNRPMIMYIHEADIIKQIKESRCGGRCDGFNDICIADTKCDDHNITGCRTCWP